MLNYNGHQRHIPIIAQVSSLLSARLFVLSEERGHKPEHRVTHSLAPRDPAAMRLVHAGFTANGPRGPEGTVELV